MEDSKKDYVHNLPVYFDNNSEAGKKYLRDDLDSNEAKVFFEAARRTSSGADFEDKFGKNFTLKYNGDGTYIVIKR
ncbi:hypothetical protein KC644_00480 [Candidatus Berkelbacteria bacterium]|nr:hypothetical protein [Candidatus Berkelbacteria bacterium]